MALDIKPTRSELIKLKSRIKQTKNGYKLLKMKRDGLFHEFRQLLSEMIKAKRELTDSYRLAKQRIDLANAIDGGLAVRAAAIANSAHPEVEVERRNIMGVVVPSVSGTPKDCIVTLKVERTIVDTVTLREGVKAAAVVLALVVAYCACISFTVPSCGGGH